MRIEDAHGRKLEYACMKSVLADFEGTEVDADAGTQTARLQEEPGGCMRQVRREAARA